MKRFLSTILLLTLSFFSLKAFAFSLSDCKSFTNISSSQQTFTLTPSFIEHLKENKISSELENSECFSPEHMFYFCIETSEPAISLLMSETSYPLVEKMESMVKEEGYDFSHYHWTVNNYSEFSSTNLPTIRSDLNQGRQLLILKTNSKMISHPFLVNINSTASKKEQIIHITLVSLFVGSLLIIALYNLFLFIKTQKTDYLNYSKYTLSVLLGTICVTGWLFFALSLFGFSYVKLSIFSMLFCITSCNSTYQFMRFTEEYIEFYSKKKFFWLLKLGTFVKASSAFLALSYFLGCFISLPNFFLDLASFIVAAGFLYIITIILLSVKDKKRESLFLLSGILMLFSCYFLYFLSNFNILPKSSYNNYYLFLGVLVEQLCFAFAIGDKILQQEKKQNRTISHLNDELKEINTGLEKTIEKKMKENHIVLSSINEGICLVYLKNENLYVSHQSTSSFLMSFLNLKKDKDFLLSEMLRRLFKDQEQKEKTEKKINSFMENKEALSLVFEDEIMYHFKGINKIFQLSLTKNEGLLDEAIVTIQDITPFKMQEKFITGLLDISASIQKYNTLESLFSFIILGINRLIPLKELSIVLLNDKSKRIIELSGNIFNSPLSTTDFQNFLASNQKDHFIINESFTVGRQSYSLYLIINDKNLRDSDHGLLKIFFTQLNGVLKTKMQAEELEKMANTDSLTTCFNRGFFDQKLSVMQEAKEAGENPLFSILYCDVNGLKKINDECGHQAGDEMIRLSSLILKKALREEDLVFRYGGDEFVAIINRTNELSIEEIEKRVEEVSKDLILSLPGGASHQIHLSLGLSLSTEKESPGELVKLADERMFENKQHFYKTHEKYR